jgi:hypothetical protein
VLAANLGLLLGAAVVAVTASALVNAGVVVRLLRWSRMRAGPGRQQHGRVDNAG